MLAHSCTTHLSLSPTTQASGPGHGEGLPRKEGVPESSTHLLLSFSLFPKGTPFQTQLEVGLVGMAQAPEKVCKP